MLKLLPLYNKYIVHNLPRYLCKTTDNLKKNIFLYFWSNSEKIPLFHAVKNKMNEFKIFILVYNV